MTAPETVSGIVKGFGLWAMAPEMTPKITNTVKAVLFMRLEMPFSFQTFARGLKFAKFLLVNLKTRAKKRIPATPGRDQQGFTKALQL
jgi:hypothetical protein